MVFKKIYYYKARGYLKATKSNQSSTISEKVILPKY